MCHKKHNPSRSSFFKQPAALLYGVASTNHVVEDDHVLAFDRFNRTGRFRGYHTRHITLIGPLFCKIQQTRSISIEVVENLCGEFSRPGIRRTHQQPCSAHQSRSDIRVANIIREHFGRVKIDELPSHYFSEQLFHRRRVIVNRNDSVDPGQCQRLGVKSTGKWLAVEFLEICRASVERHLPMLRPRPSVLGAEKQIRLH